ncbi:MAG: FMN-binding protein [Clostridiales bacterium]|nr:FMN-binding protein [Clostridiales bacterium]
MSESNSRRKLPAYLVLTIITLVAGLILGGVYSLTKDPITAREKADADSARKKVLPAAQSFVDMSDAMPEGLKSLFAGLDEQGNTVGYAAQMLTKGYGGEIEVTLGADISGQITGLMVGGSNFSETAGLGARSKDEAFTSQFAGRTAPLRVVKGSEEKAADTIDAITSATITSKAVTKAANDIMDALDALLTPDTEGGTK